jgi:hypothetical protein
MNIRVPLDEMRRLGREDQGVRFTDDSGYFGSLAVYHSLHCIVGTFFTHDKRNPYYFYGRILMDYREEFTVTYMRSTIFQI